MLYRWQGIPMRYFQPVLRNTPRFGKSEQYIYYRMKLNELIPDAKKLLRENSITLGLAMELARYGKDLQKTI